MKIKINNNYFTGVYKPESKILNTSMTKFPTPPSVNLNTSLGGGGSSARALNPSDFNNELSTTLANSQG